MENPQYIQYLNTFGADIDVKLQPCKGADALFNENTSKKNSFEIFGGLLFSKYNQLYTRIKHFTVDKDEEERQRLIDSIEELKGIK